MAEPSVRSAFRDLLWCLYPLPSYDEALAFSKVTIGAQQPLALSMRGLPN